MVRLKHENRVKLITDEKKFQFLYGAIKTLEIIRKKIDQISFNSSMVRLKLYLFDSIKS